MYKRYQRISIAEMRPVTKDDTLSSLRNNGVSVSNADIMNGSPHIYDMIARNPSNHNDKWLVAADYFKSNFKLIGENNG